MLDLQEDVPLEMLRQFSVYFHGDLIENFGAAKMVLNNENGKGEIRLYELFKGFTAWIYNIEFTSELDINMTFSKSTPYYFGFNVAGYQHHKYAEEKDFRKIHQGQNFILVGEPGTTSIFTVPQGIQYKCCYLIINPALLRESIYMTRRPLWQELQSTFDNEMGEPYRYFGEIDMNVGIFADIIVENTRTDLVGRLITEGAILNMLGSQIEAHDKATESKAFQPDLTKAELSRISDLGDYIVENMKEGITVDRLSRYSALSPKKVQAGVRFLYGCTANEYMTRLRMEQARELMHATDMNVSEICYHTGYSNRSYFSKVFMQHYGMLPSNYKKTMANKDMLFEISYRSFARPELSNQDVEAIINTARKMNPKFNITGSLIYHKRVFFQLIEGPKKHILKLYQNILNDDRHADVELMWKGYKVRRDFGSWDLATITDQGILKIEQQGNTSNLELGHVLGRIDQNSLASENLWRKVRNIIKVKAA